VTPSGPAQVEARKGAVSPGFMYHFPWESVGNYKYALYLPFMFVLATGQDDADDWCYHMMVIVVLRYLQVRVGFWSSFPLAHVASPCVCSFQRRYRLGRVWCTGG
jgi:hypothetical protein